LGGDKTTATGRREHLGKKKTLGPTAFKKTTTHNTRWDRPGTSRKEKPEGTMIDFKSVRKNSGGTKEPRSICYSWGKRNPQICRGGKNGNWRREIDSNPGGGFKKACGVSSEKMGCN